MANMEKIDEVLGYIEAHPDRHDQSSWYRVRDGAWSETPDGVALAPDWRCGSTMCVAGHAAVAAGYAPYRPEGEYSWLMVGRDGEVCDPYVLGRDLLGLDDEQADVLFTGTNDLAEVRAVVEAIRVGDDPEEALCEYREGLEVEP